MFGQLAASYAFVSASAQCEVSHQYGAQRDVTCKACTGIT